MGALDLDRLAAAPPVRDPFDYVIVPGFVRAEVFPALARDFPAIRQGGSFPATALAPGPAFRDLLRELAAPAFAAALGAKFGLDLGILPTLITVRGRSRRADGRIHTDSEDKVVSALLYLNGPWSDMGGRLRLLRDGHDLDAVAAEVPPDDGTLVAFRRGPASFHGHRPYVGPRRVVQVNWLQDAGALSRAAMRHRLAARLKGLLPRPRA